MKTPIIIVAMVLSSLAPPAFANHSSDPVRASSDLVHAAAGLERSLDRHGARRYLDRRSDSMLHEARRLQHAIHRGAHPRAIARQFHRVQERYRELRVALAHARRLHHDRHVGRRLDRLQQSMSTLRVALVDMAPRQRPHVRDYGYRRGHAGAWRY
jgi:hypothetical protein